MQIITFYSTFKRKTFTKEDLVLMVLMRGDLSITDHDLNVGVWVTDNLTMKIRFGVFSIPRQKKVSYHRMSDLHHVLFLY